MRRIPLAQLGIAAREMLVWQDACEARGFDYHSIDGAYWVDDTLYALSALEWSALQTACANWQAMFEEATKKLFSTGPQALLAIGIPAHWHEAVHHSWQTREPSIGWRWDSLWDGKNWRLLECNCSTWSGLLECVEPQRDWAKACGLHQPNTLQADGEAWLARETGGAPLTAYALSTQRVEVATAEEVTRWGNVPGGGGAKVVPLERLWRSAGVDAQSWGMKVAPWHWWLLHNVEKPPMPMGHAHWTMPLWTTIWHSKAFLAWVWQQYPNEPTLIEASFTPLVGVASHAMVRKPFWGAEGHGVERTSLADAASIYQRFVDAPVDGKYPTIGAWCMNNRLSALYMRECDAWKLDEWSRMLPYAVV